MYKISPIYFEPSMCMFRVEKDVCCNMCNVIKLGREMNGCCLKQGFEELCSIPLVPFMASLRIKPMYFPFSTTCTLKAHVPEQIMKVINAAFTEDNSVFTPLKKFPETFSEEERCVLQFLL